MKQQPEQTRMAQSQSNGDESLSSNVNGNSSIIEFLNQEQKCMDNDSELDIESIFEEINRLSDESDERSVDEILREAELLMCKQHEIESDLKSSESDPTTSIDDNVDSFNLCLLDRHLDTISEKTTPHNTKSSSSNDGRNELTMQTNADDLELDQKERCRTARRPIKTIKVKSKPQECISPDPAKTNDDDNNANHVIEQEIPSSEFSNDDKQLVYEDGITLERHQSSPSSKHEIEFEHSLPILSKPRTSRSSSVATIVSPNATMSASSTFSWTRERQLEQQIDTLRETLKDTEERLHSLRLQYDNVSQMHRKLRDTNHQIQDEMERLKIDAQHLHECANILRTELQAARKDRAEAIDVQAMLQRELDTTRMEKRRACDEVDANARQILDLQRQCKEMERILARKNPDAMHSLLGIGSKKSNDEAANRRQLEQRIAQLESDAREQDRKAQLILANVQSRFSSVQSKYETHISDLETQVLSLQQINQILNEKIEAQSRGLKSPNNNYMIDQESCATQTESANDKTSVESVQTQTDAKPSNLPSPPAKTITKKPTKQIVTTKEETQLLATVRGMRVDLAIKEKALQRLTRELDECKKTIRKLQKDNESARNEKSIKKPYDAAQFSEANGSFNQNQLQERVKLLEMDYRALHDKRLLDLKTLQTAHERELSANKETVRLLEQRLAERDEAFSIIQKHNKIPIDYFALKAKVSSLERRHTEREQRLHILVDALSKGRLSGLSE